MSERTAIGFSDIHGKLKVLHLLEERDSAGFDGSSIEGYADIEDSDLLLEADADARDVLGTSFRMAEILTTEGELYEKSPRSILKQMMEDSPYDMTLGVEPEFFVLGEEGEFLDEDGYFDPDFGSKPSLPHKMVEALQSAGIDAYGYHSEVAGSQWEMKADFLDKNAVEVADETLLYKEIVRTVAEENGKQATFMPKLNDENGSGMHIHVSLWDGDTNVFADGEGLSDEARYFAGGILEHAKALSAVVSPTVNSYKRLVPDREAPTKIAAAESNRSALVRVPPFSSGEGARIEYRAPDPSCNPYLAFTAIMAAGLDGIERELDPGFEEYEGENVYQDDSVEDLPESLGEALDYLEEDEVIMDALRPVAETYLELKREEADEYETFLEGEDRDPRGVYEDFDWERYFDV